MLTDKNKKLSEEKKIGKTSRSGRRISRIKKKEGIKRIGMVLYKTLYKYKHGWFKCSCKWIENMYILVFNMVVEGAVLLYKSFQKEKTQKKTGHESLLWEAVPVTVKDVHPSRSAPGMTRDASFS